MVGMEVGSRRDDVSVMAGMARELIPIEISNRRRKTQKAQKDTEWSLPKLRTGADKHRITQIIRGMARGS